MQISKSWPFKAVWAEAVRRHPGTPGNWPTSQREELREKKSTGRGWPIVARNQEKMGGNFNKILGEDYP